MNQTHPSFLGPFPALHFKISCMALETRFEIHLLWPHSFPGTEAQPLPPGGEAPQPTATTTSLLEMHSKLHKAKTYFCLPKSVDLDLYPPHSESIGNFKNSKIAIQVRFPCFHGFVFHIDVCDAMQ